MDSFWIRQCTVIAGGKRFNMDELDIEFNVPFDNDEEPDIAGVTIYNLSENTINSIKKEQNVIVNAGYKGDVGTIFKGTIQKTRTRWNGVDKKTELTIGDGSQQWLTAHVSAAYGNNITANAILGDLTGRFGLELGKLNLVNNLTYPKGRIIDCSLKDAIIQIVHECDTEFKISQGRIFIMPHEQGIFTGFVLNKDSGLIGSPEAFEKEEDGKTFKGFKVKMLLNHRITINSLLQIQSKTANGVYRVSRGSHRNNGSDFLTTVEVME
jgi:hypothetical protein